MKQPAKIVALLLLLISGTLSLRANCDTVYSYTETGCKYASGDDALQGYLLNELLPIIAKYYGENKTQITKLLIVMTIDQQGQISNIHFPYFTGTPELVKQLKAKILEMKGWTTGTINGKPVCSEVFWGMNCILWR